MLRFGLPRNAECGCLLARRAVRVIVRHGGDARLSRRLHTLLRATKLTGDGDRSVILKSDQLSATGQESGGFGGDYPRSCRHDGPANTTSISLRLAPKVNILHEEPLLLSFFLS